MNQIKSTGAKRIRLADTGSDVGLGACLAAVARAELLRASEVLGWSGVRRHTGVHEARKAMRRLRSVLAFGRGVFGDAWRALDRAVRRHNRALSRLRDAHAVLGSAARLRRESDAGLHADWSLAIKPLRQQRDRLLTRSLREDPDLGAYRQVLICMIEDVTALPWSQLRAEQVERGLKISLKRVAEAEREARRRPDAERRHGLRRRLRRLRMQWNAVRALARSAERPELARCMRGVLKRLHGDLPKRSQLQRRSDALGWEQNLRVLDEALRDLDLALAQPCRDQVRAVLRASERRPA